ncbi:MAG: 50S ribosomal protein L21e, partial [Candidatus Pacearchaeota archaeon]
GKISLSEYFKSFNEGEKVSIVEEKSLKSNFPKRIIGRIGRVIGKRGEYFLIELKEGKKLKNYAIHPINLRRNK